MWQIETQFSEVIERVPGVKSFRFPRKGLNLRYRAGQYFYVTIVVNSKPLVHHFSFSSSPAEKNYIEFTKRITESDYSRTLDNIKPGTWALIEGPEGKFTLPNSKRKLAFICGGIGVTPVKSMLNYVKRKQRPLDCLLLYSNTNPRSIIFKEELDELGKEPNITIHHFVSSSSQQLKPEYHNGYINKASIEKLVPDYKERLFYLSGPPSMVESIGLQVAQLSVDARSIKMDIFTGYK
ncbi:MAG: FAD-dependent oxidoreductase [Dehalococcoidales bacterium]|jgi:ferredoxin-NADP reductase|nr:FAD-dependent oxidoreductase [Dehalococcoidales bacterium]MDD3264576.1 FAD-dependent oxidoreductase [Dehalococcoidales bacterium]MDD4322218.1 FAD-dependent oxidoreductase [Dehalococcoidales bacterium]MDD4793798.1 FAD-dependent oxidoreductase [Dehalococcoidales bacterium]MDD5122276.1 FAD-dependent oxidoreductase [Dehalococcoidales bacterium]